MLINDKVDAVFIPDSPSRIKATDYNQIKNEIQECIKEAGLTPTKDVIQLPQALKILTAQSGAEEVAKIEAAGQEQLDAINTAGQTQTAAVNEAGETQINNINTAGAQAVQDAQDAANTATSKAAEAATSATEAANSASAAASSASAASGSASTAATQASNAAGSAELAQKWATQTTAEVVSGQGYGAKYYAEQAADSASSASTSASTATTKATEASASATAAAQSAQEAADSAESINPDNLANKGLENTGRLTNCITKIPQDIKFELSSEGTLTLKAGSKAWYPNGKDDEGNLLFDNTVTASDITWVFEDTANWDNVFVFLGGNKRAQAFRPTGSTNSGSADPGTTGTTYYNISDNYIDAHNTGGLDRGLTFPLAIVKVEAGKVTQIKQVFNGFGYIGQVLYVLPGVEGLSPGGRNADGSLCNYTMTVSNVLTRSFTWSCDDGQFVFVGQYNTATATEATEIISSGELHNYFQQSEPPSTIYTNSIWHKLDENKVYKTDNDTTWNPISLFVVGRLFNTGAGTSVSSFTIGNPVAMLDMSNTSYICKQGMPSRKNIDLTLGASGTDYIAPANGYVHISKAAGADNQNMYIWLPDSYMGVGMGFSRTNAVVELVCPVKAGERFRINYNFSGNTSRFKFIYAEGEK